MKNHLTPKNAPNNKTFASVSHSPIIHRLTPLSSPRSEFGLPWPCFANRNSNSNNTGSNHSPRYSSFLFCSNSSRKNISSSYIRRPSLLSRLHLEIVAFLATSALVLGSICRRRLRFGRQVVGVEGRTFLLMLGLDEPLVVRLTLLD
ncbi:hypothetical protein ABW19_dt0209591 [Dactylella cylindrospora]|nr:hypothetical protein ABW19_dt0209591 [Dactylella cylindrospora]